VSESKPGTGPAGTFTKKSEEGGKGGFWGAYTIKAEALGSTSGTSRRKSKSVLASNLSKNCEGGKGIFRI